MRKTLLLVTLLIAGVFAVDPALGQQRRDKDKVLENAEPMKPDAADEAQGIMRRTLPYKPSQTLKYFGGDGKYEGYAVRKHNTIRFYDPEGTFVGKAERVTQRLTTYYAADGTFLGRRMQQRMTMANTATTSKDKGFITPESMKKAQEEAGN
jgi:hypothetical protein